jgi:hypothetical protein
MFQFLISPSRVGRTIGTLLTLVSRIFTSWNLINAWLVRLDGLRRAA